MNEQLLEQFEASARSSSFDAEATKALLQKVIDATPKPASDLSAPNHTVLKIVNNYIEGGIGDRAADGCTDGKTTTGQPCGRWNSEIRDNVFFTRRGGNVAAVPANSHQALVEGNTYANPSPQNATVDLNGSDTVFRKNNVYDLDVSVVPEAQRTSIHDNIFESATLLKQLYDSNQQVEQFEALLSYVRLTFEEHWKSLPDAGRRTNEELLSRFESSARENPPDKIRTQKLLQRVIDVTPR